MTPAERAWEAFQRIEPLTTDDEIVQATIANPGVMVARVLDRAFAGGQPSRAAQVVATLRNRFEKAPETYPIGKGPIESIAVRVLQGELAPPTARELAAGSCWQLSVPYVNSLAGMCSFRAQDGEIALATTLGDLLVAGADALHAADPDDEEGLLVRWMAWMSRIEVVKIEIHKTADGALLEETARGALALMGGGVPHDSMSMLGDLMFRLGTLYIDPWLVGRDQVNYARAIDDWRHLAVGRRLGGDPVLVPTTAEAFRKGEGALRRALQLVQGPLRGKVLKALVQVLHFRARVLDEAIDHAELVALAREGLLLVEQNRDPEPREFLKAVLEVEGQGESFDDTVWEDTEVAPHRRAELAIMALTSVKDPLRAIDILTRTRELFDHVGDEALRVERWKRGLVAFHALHRAGISHRFDVEAGVISRALATDKDNQELVVLREIVELARERDVSEVEDLLLYTMMQLRRGAAVNAATRGASDDAVGEYASALSIAIELALPHEAISFLQKMRLAVTQSETVNAGLLALRMTSPRLPELEKLLGERAQVVVWELSKLVMAKLATTRAPPDAFLMAHQLAKGVRFGAAVAAMARLDTSELVDAGATLGEPAAGALSDEWIMAGYAIADARLSGDSPAVRAANLRLRIDTEIRTAWGRSAALPVAHSIETLQRALPGDTALLSLFLGSDPEGGVSLFSLGVTNDRVVPSVTQTHFEGSLAILEDKETGQRAIQSSLATLVAHAREAIRESPLGVPLNADGVTAFSPIAGILKGALHFLSECERAGKTRLLLAPHGALHFFPFHLLGDPASPLAERWQVTYVPSLLAMARPASALRERSLCALGLDYLAGALNPHDMPFLAAARAESEECAKVFETPPYLDEAATPARLHEGLATARYVHFSGHGALDVVAPAFQTLFLAPADGHDGRVFAHELLARSFAGCEMVSLSACESGLGRFDLADNLMGIPAALLAGGVRYVIATLWEVREAPARLFFRMLYEALHGGATCVDAFEKARRATRARYPAFRDWGAFILMGHEGVQR